MCSPPASSLRWFTKSEERQSAGRYALSLSSLSSSSLSSLPRRCGRCRRCLSSLSFVVVVVVPRCRRRCSSSLSSLSLVVVVIVVRRCRRCRSSSSSLSFGVVIAVLRRCRRYRVVVLRCCRRCPSSSLFVVVCVLCCVSSFVRLLLSTLNHVTSPRHTPSQARAGPGHTPHARRPDRRPRSTTHSKAQKSPSPTSLKQDTGNRKLQKPSEFTGCIDLYGIHSSIIDEFANECTNE